VLPDALLEDRLPGYQLEAKSVLYYCEASADEAGDAGKAATDILAGISRHLMADSLDLLSLQGRHCADRDMDFAILGRR